MQAGPIETVRFGRYEVLRPIGEGGMARVFLCLQRGAGRFQKRLVLKVLHPRFAGNEEAYQMFLEEARVMARLHHPNIVDVFEVDTVDGIPYIAIEYVNGPTLGRLYRHVGRPTPQNIGYFICVMRQVCEGLHYAHTLVVDGRPAGVIHRDVSSQNILIDARSGVAKLIDFGIAKAMDADKETQMGILKGRLHYIAPEVLAGARPDARADLYAVGVMLHRMLYGQMPYADHDLLARRRPAAPAGQWVEGMPLALRDIAARALSLDPDDRHASAAELGAELEEICTLLGTHQAQIPPFLARVFPRGEADWQQPDMSFDARSLEGALLQSAVPWADPGHAPPRMYYALLALALLTLVAAAAFAGLVVAALVTRTWGPL